MNYVVRRSIQDSTDTELTPFMADDELLCKYAESVAFYISFDMTPIDSVEKAKALLILRGWSVEEC